jgi:hypothetical protein
MPFVCLFALVHVLAPKVYVGAIFIQRAPIVKAGGSAVVKRCESGVLHIGVRYKNAENSKAAQKNKP